MGAFRPRRPDPRPGGTDGCRRRRIAVWQWRGPPTANAESFAREPRFLGYKIRINRTFYSILDGAIEFFDARHIVVSRAGQVVRPVEMPIDEYAEALRTSIREYVLGHSPNMESFALWMHRIGRVKREVRMPEAKRENHILFFFRQQMVLFVIAHEMGHVYRGHLDKPTPRDRLERQAQELEADEFAADLMFRQRVYYPPGFEFSMIPDVGAEVATVWARQTLQAVSLLLVLYEMFDQAAAQLKVRWSEDHPPAVDRYALVRQVCVGAGFDPATEIQPGDDVFAMLQQISALFDWS